MFRGQGGVKAAANELKIWKENQELLALEAV